MPARSLLPALLFGLILSTAPLARAQSGLELIDPDVGSKPAAEPDPGDDALDAPVPIGSAEPETVKSAAVKPKKGEPTETRPASAVVPPKETPPAVAPPREAPALPAIAEGAKGFGPIAVPVLGKGELDAAWETWRTANETGNLTAADKAHTQLLRLKEDFGIDALDSYAMTMARRADQLRDSGNTARALGLAEAAVSLAPSLPAARWSLARALVSEDPSAIGQASGEAFRALSTTFQDPRFARPAVADLTSILLLALLGTAWAVVLVLFARRAKHAFHDLHHLFPKAAARWQTATVGVLLLSLPLVFRLGLLPLLLTLFAAVTLYLSRAERIVAAVALALVALVPLATYPLASFTSFAGTVDEDLYVMERGGPEADLAAARIEARRKDERAKFEELFALAHLHQRRGRLAEAIAVYKEAAILKSEDPRLSNNLGAALQASGDLAGAEALYQAASEADPKSAAAFFNLAVLRQRRSVTIPGDPGLVEANKAEKAREAALALEPTLAARVQRIETGGAANRVLITLPLAAKVLNEPGLASIAAERVEAQLATLVNGGGGLSRSLILAALAFFAAFVGGASRRFIATRACEKCGRSACSRCDPQVSPGGGLCAQCVNVFARKAAVPPQIKVRKQAEVAAHLWKQGKISSALGLLCSGGGHLFLGAPVRGALYAFLFFFALMGLGLREGLVRVPYGATPLSLRLVPLILLLILVYALSFLSLRKRLPRES